MSQLFRTAAVEARLNPLLGPVSRARPLRGHLLTLLALALTASVLGTLVFGRMASVIKVGGVLETTEGDVTIHTATSGVVRRLLVSEGARVEAGAVLAEIVPTTGEQTLTRLMNALDEEQQALTARINGTREQFQSRDNRLHARLRAARQQSEAAREQLALAARAVEVAAAQRQRVGRLAARGFVPRQALEEAETHLITKRQARLEARQNLSAGEAAVMADGLELAALPMLLETTLAELRQQLAALHRERVTLDARRRSALTASVAGQITGMRLRTGQHVAEGEVAMTILPASARYQAALLVPASQIGRVSARSPVQVQLAGRSSPQRLEAALQEVPGSAVQRYRGQPLREPSFPVKAKFEGTPDQAHWRPGTALEASIQGPARPLYRWLLDPAEALAARLRTGDSR